MTELRDRLDALADAALAGVRLDDPSAAPPVGADPGSARRRAWPWLGAAAALVLVVVAVVVVGRGRGDEGEPVTAGPGTTEARAEPPPAPVLSVVFVDAASGLGAPLGLDVSVSGSVEGEAADYLLPVRSSAEVEGPPGGDQVSVERGLIVDLPGPGSAEVAVSGAVGAVTCPVEVEPGARLIVPVSTRDGLACGMVETVEEWAGDSTELGLDHVGLREDEAVATIEGDGYTSRIVGRDGIEFVVTADAVPSRFDLWVYDDVVVAAGGVGSAVEDTPRTAEPLAVVVVSTEGQFVLGGEVVVAVGNQAVTRPWPSVGPTDDVVGGVLFPDLPAGAAQLEVTGQGLCTSSFDLSGSGTVVTVELPAEESLPSGECRATVETLAEHVARVTERWGGDGEPEEGYVGKTEAEALSWAEDHGRTVRVADRDGVALGLDSSLDPNRVNLVIYDDEVRAAALF